MSTGFQNVPVLPLDEAFALTAAFKADADPRKVSLGAGVYRDEKGRPWILPSVKEVRSPAIISSRVFRGIVIDFKET